MGATAPAVSGGTVANVSPPTSKTVKPEGAEGDFINRLDATFGDGGLPNTIADKTQLARIGYFRYIYGDASTVGDGTDGLYGNYRSRHRDYDEGDPRSLHRFSRDVLTLTAHCGIDGEPSTDCKDGHIESGMIRFALPIRPGSFIEIRCRMPSAPYAWPAFWLNPGLEIPPETVGGKANFSGLHWPPEIDIFDQFGFNGMAPGHYLISMTPTGGNDAAYGWPHDLFRSSDWGSAWFYTTKPDLTAGFHTFGLDWGRNNVLSFLFDGSVYRRRYYEWNAQGNAPAHLIASLQIGAKFNDLSAISDNGGRPGGWDWPIRYIRVWERVD